MKSRITNRQRRIAEFHDALRALGFPSYAAYLRSDHWADVKRRYRASKLCRHACAACDAKDRPIHIHHRTYKRIGREWLMDLIEVCADCHARIHETEAHTRRHVWAATSNVVRGTRKAKAREVRPA